MFLTDKRAAVAGWVGGVGTVMAGSGQGKDGQWHCQGSLAGQPARAGRVLGSGQVNAELQSADCRHSHDSRRHGKGRRPRRELLRRRTRRSTRRASGSATEAASLAGHTARASGTPARP